MKKQIANIATDEKFRLEGLRILGVIPISVSYIQVSTHIKLCKIKEEIKKVKLSGSLEDFYNPKIQEGLLPLVAEYCVTALCNEKRYSFLIKKLIRKKVMKNSHAGILNLMMTIQKLDEPAFFLTYCKMLMQADNTLLQEEKQSLDA